jgi:hypothetical protein
LAPVRVNQSKKEEGGKATTTTRSGTRPNKVKKHGSSQLPIDSMLSLTERSNCIPEGRPSPHRTAQKSSLSYCSRVEHEPPFSI